MELLDCWQLAVNVMVNSLWVRVIAGVRGVAPVGSGGSLSHGSQNSGGGVEGHAQHLRRGAPP